MKNKFQQIRSILNSMENELDLFDEEKKDLEGRRREVQKLEEKDRQQDLIVCDLTQTVRKYDAKIERIIEWMDNFEFDHNCMDTAYTIPLEEWGRFRAMVEEQI